MAESTMSVAFRVATRREERARVLARKAAAQADADAYLDAAAADFVYTYAQACTEYQARMKERARATGRHVHTAAADQADVAALIWAAHRRVAAAAHIADAIATCHKRVVR